MCMSVTTRRTTIEMKPEYRAKRLALAALTVSSELQVMGPYYTAITHLEVVSGLLCSKQATAVRRLLKALKTLTLDVAAAVRSLEARRTLEKQGLKTGITDSLTAALTVLHGGRLPARKLRHFERVPILPPAEIS